MATFFDHPLQPFKKSASLQLYFDIENGLNTFWEATYRQNFAKLIGVCCRYTRDRAAAKDLAHDAFWIAIAKVSSFENKGPFDAWLRRIVVNIPTPILLSSHLVRRLC